MDRAIDDLAPSDDPAALGTYKANLRVFSYGVGRAYRLLYLPVSPRDEIVPLRVCDHKYVYGKD